MDIQFGVIDIDNKRAALFRHVQTIGIQFTGIAADPGTAMDIENHRIRRFCIVRTVQKDIHRICIISFYLKRFPFCVFPDFLFSFETDHLFHHFSFQAHMLTLLFFLLLTHSVQAACHIRLVPETVFP